MDQLICASLSHTHDWYEVGMLKVPAISDIMYIHHPVDAQSAELDVTDHHHHLFYDAQGNIIWCLVLSSTTKM